MTLFSSGMGWQIFDKSKPIKPADCPDKYAGWQGMRGDGSKMKAKCATDEEMEAAGVCAVKDYWDETPEAEAGSTPK